MNINILGIFYTIIENVDPKIDNGLKGSFGYTSFFEKKIVIADLDKIESWENDSSATKQYQNKNTMRHEIIHAFLFESGLWGSALNNDSWATNEEMVDWFALQWPKIHQAMKDADCLP